MKNYDEIDAIPVETRKEEERKRIPSSHFDEVTWNISKGVMLIIIGDLRYEYDDAKKFALFMGEVAREGLRNNKSIINNILDKVSFEECGAVLEYMNGEFIWIYNIFYKCFGYTKITPYDFISYAETLNSVRIPLIMSDYKKDMDKALQDTGIDNILQDIDNYVAGNILVDSQSPCRGWGLVAKVLEMEREGKTREEMAYALHRMKSNGFEGVSDAIIGALLHPKGDIKGLAQYGKDLRLRGEANTATTPEGKNTTPND